MRAGSSRRLSTILPPRMRPTAHLDDPPLGFQVDPVVTVEGIRLHVPAIVFQEGGRPSPLVRRRVVEDRQRVQRVADVRPEPRPCTSASPRHRGSSPRCRPCGRREKQAPRAWPRRTRAGGIRPSASHHPSIVCREIRTPCRWKIPSRRCKGRWSAPLQTMTWAISPGPAKPPGIASGRLAAPPPRSAPPASNRFPAVALCGRISCGHGPRRTTSKAASRVARWSPAATRPGSPRRPRRPSRPP